MRLLLIPITALLLGLADSQNLSGQPACATSCIISAVQEAGCQPQDLSCQCGPTKAIIGASAAPCLLAACTGTELVQAQSAGNAQCSSYSATATAAAANNHVAVVLARPTRGNTLFDNSNNNNNNNMEEDLNAKSETTPTPWVARDQAPSNPLEDANKRQVKAPSSPAILNAAAVPMGVVPFDMKKVEPDPNPPPHPPIEQEEEEEEEEEAESEDAPQRQAEHYRITTGIMIKAQQPSQAQVQVQVQAVQSQLLNGAKPEVVQLVQQEGVFPAMATAAPAAQNVFGRSDDEDEDEDEDTDDALFVALKNGGRNDDVLGRRGDDDDEDGEEHTDDVVFAAQAKNGKNDENEQQQKKRFVVVTLVPVQKRAQERGDGMQKGEPMTVDRQGLFIPAAATAPEVVINTMPLREEEEVGKTVIYDHVQKKVEVERDNRNTYTWLQVKKADKGNSWLPVSAEASNARLKLLNEAAVATTSTGRATTTYTSTSTSTSTVTSTVHSASTGAAAAGAAKLGGGALGGLLGVVGVMVFGM